MDKRDPFVNTSMGIGQCMRTCFDDYGVRKFIIGSGGSAFSDGGFGAVRAMNVFDFKTKNGDKIGGNAYFPFGQVMDVQSAELIDREFVEQTEVLLPCDVTSPLLGPQGAAHVFGPQKGAQPNDLDRLDKSIEHIIRVYL